MQNKFLPAVVDRFKKLDVERSGTIPLAELQMVLQKLEPRLSDAEVLRFVSSSAACCVRYDQFVKWLWEVDESAEAATKIQAVFRGKQSRQLNGGAGRKKAGHGPNAGDNPELEAAATKIQAVHRRNAAGREVQERRDQRHREAEEQRKKAEELEEAADQKMQKIQRAKLDQQRAQEEQATRPQSRQSQPASQGRQSTGRQSAFTGSTSPDSPRNSPRNSPRSSPTNRRRR